MPEVAFATSKVHDTVSSRAQTRQYECDASFHAVHSETPAASKWLIEGNRDLESSVSPTTFTEAYMPSDIAHLIIAHGLRLHSVAMHDVV